MLIETTLYPPIKNFQKSLITSKFNANRGGKKHKGLDIGVKSGTEVFAPADGVVIDSDSNRSTCGGFIKIKHDDVVTKYCHLRKVLVKPKDVVKVGQLIGLSGGDLNDPGKGHTTGAHLHFEVIRNGEFLNPEIVFGSNQMMDIEQADNFEYTNSNNKNNFKTYDLLSTSQDDFKTYDLIRNKINEEEEDSNDETNLGNIIKNSFTDKSCKEKYENVDDGSFNDEYTYIPNSENFCCRFSKCKMTNNINENCKKIEVTFGGETHIINICSSDFNLIDKTTKKDELIGKLPTGLEYSYVYVTRGLTTKVKLTSKKNTTTSSSPKKSKSTSTYTTPSKLAQLKTSEKDSFNKPYSFSKTSEKDSFNKSYDLKKISQPNLSSDYYKLPATSQKDSFNTSKKFPSTSESKVKSEELINEINRIISIMK